MQQSKSRERHEHGIYRCREYGNRTCEAAERAPWPTDSQRDRVPRGAAARILRGDDALYGVRNGARIARLEGKIGVLEPGKLADIVLASATDYDQYPVVDPFITLAQNCNGRAVWTVIVDGKVVMKDREFKSFDLEPVRLHVEQQYKSIMDALPRKVG